MKIGALSLFTRTSDQRTINIAAWHNPRSYTWRWVLSLHRFKADEQRHGWLWSKHGASTTIRIPHICLITFQTQQPMWKP